MIPFSGFYYTAHDIDLEDLCYGDEPSKKACKIYEKLFITSGFSFRDVFTHYGKIVYLPEFESILSDKLEIEILDNELVFEKIIHPREYNFTTDRLFAFVSHRIINKAYEYINSSEEKISVMNEICEQMFKSRSGFISFYEYQWKLWGNNIIEDWDFNQYGAMFKAIICDEYFNIPQELEYIELRHEKIDECISAGANSEKVKKVLDKLFNQLLSDANQE